MLLTVYISYLVTVSYRTGNCTVTITSARYWAMLETLEVDADNVDTEVRFQQDGAPAYTPRE
jgi:hypothetical protein